MKTITVIGKILRTIIIVSAVILTITMAGVRLVGLTPYAVISGSMEPTYKTGSVVYVKKCDCKTLTVGDPITFMLDENTVATHRIVEILTDEAEPDNIRYVTKGDNNESVDGVSVSSKNVIGKRCLYTLRYFV